MKERIFKYLQDAGSGVAAARILSDVLRIPSSKVHSPDSVLACFLRQDPRFVFAEGLWHLSTICRETIQWNLRQALVLHIQSANRFGKLQGLRGAFMWADGRFQEYEMPVSVDILSKIRSESESHLLVLWSSWELKLWNGLFQSQGLEAWQGERIYLRDLAARVLRRMPSRLQPKNLASILDLSPADEERPRDVVRYLQACWLLLLERIPDEFRRNLDSLRAWMDDQENAVDYSRFAFGPNFLSRLPNASGVYVMKDRGGTVIYVGKSRNLKRRVSSYFTSRALRNAKIARIHEQLHSIDVYGTDNEIEALLLEMRLIWEFRPAINLQTEVHERRTERLQGSNYLLFVPGTEQKKAEIYFLLNGVFAGRQSVSLGRPPSKRLREKLESLFFTQHRGTRRRGDAWEKEIVSRWVTTNRKRLNYIDVDEAGSYASLLEQLRHYLHDPDKLARKVYYR